VNTLDDQLRDHYRGMLLNSDVIDDMLSSEKNSRFAWFSWQSPQVRFGLSAIAALFLVVFSLGMHDYGTIKERTSSTLYEAAMNHSTRLELEFESENIEVINQNMTQLPFEVALPESFTNTYALLGSRYCTINGELAAHVKFVDEKTAKQVSLFMARSVEDLQGIAATDDKVNGVNVKLWTESGLFYAMASRSPLKTD